MTWPEAIVYIVLIVVGSPALIALMYVFMAIVEGKDPAELLPWHHKNRRD